MAMLKDDKKKLAKVYAESVGAAKNAVILRHGGVPVNEINSLRMDVTDMEGQLQVVKKRVFLKGIEGKFEGPTLDDLNGSVAVLVSANESDEHAPLKAIQKHVKKWKKDKKEFEIEYVGGRYEGEWKDAEYVTELANLPSKEELIGKFLYMLNHPVSSFARVLKAVADKDSESAPEAVAEEAKEESKEEVKEEAKEESKEEVKEEVKEEPKEEAKEEVKEEGKEEPKEE